MRKLIISTTLLLLSGCAGWGGPPPAPGETRAAVEARLGHPTAVYQDGAVTELEYATGPAGQYTHMARFGADGRLISFEQVLTGEKFATIRPGKATKASVLLALGRPMQVRHYASVDGDVWAYRYKEQQVWDSVMDVQFNRDGVVTAMVN
jgi:hypothetical protein